MSEEARPSGEERRRRISLLARERSGRARREQMHRKLTHLLGPEDAARWRLLSLSDSDGIRAQCPVWSERPSDRHEGPPLRGEFSSFDEAHRFLAMLLDVHAGQRVFAVVGDPETVGLIDIGLDLLIRVVRDLVEADDDCALFIVGSDSTWCASVDLVQDEAGQHDEFGIAWWSAAGDLSPAPDEWFEVIYRSIDGHDVRRLTPSDLVGRRISVRVFEPWELTGHPAFGRRDALVRRTERDVYGDCTRLLADLTEGLVWQDVSYVAVDLSPRKWDESLCDLSGRTPLTCNVEFLTESLRIERDRLPTEQWARPHLFATAEVWLGE